MLPAPVHPHPLAGMLADGAFRYFHVPAGEDVDGFGIVRVKVVGGNLFEAREKPAIRQAACEARDKESAGPQCEGG